MGNTLCTLARVRSIPMTWSRGVKKAEFPQSVVSETQVSTQLVPQTGHSWGNRCVAISTSGQLVVTGNGDNSALLWDAATSKQLRRFVAGRRMVGVETYGVTSVALSLEQPESRHLVTASEGSGIAQLWEVKSGREIWRVDEVSKVLGFSPNSEFVILRTKKRRGVQHNSIWNRETGKELWVFGGEFAISPDSRRIAVFAGNVLFVRNLLSGVITRELVGHQGRIASLAWSPSDGRYLISGSVDETVRLWDTKTGDLVRSFSDDIGAVKSVAFSSRGAYFLVNDSKSTKVFDFGKRCCVFTAARSTLPQFTPDGKGLVCRMRLRSTGIGKLSFVRWDIATRTKLGPLPDGNQSGFRLKGHVSNIYDKTSGIVFFPDGKSFLVNGQSHYISAGRIYMDGETRNTRYMGQTGPIAAASFTTNPPQLVLGTGSVHFDWWMSFVWNLQEGRESLRRSISAKNRSWIGSKLRDDIPVWPVGTSNDGELAVSGIAPEVWRISDGELQTRLKSPGTICCAFSPEGDYVLTGDVDGVARLWKDGEFISKFTGHKASFPINAIAFSSDGKLILTGSSDTTARLWQRDTARELHRFEGHQSSLTAVAFAFDDQKVVTGDTDGSVRLWDAGNDGAMIRRYIGHSGRITSAAVATDGRLLTASADKTARLWNLETGEEIRRSRMVGHSDAVLCAAFSPSGSHVITGGFDGTARLWNSQSGRELCKLINFRDGSWAVIDAIGRYDASNGGQIEGMHWVVGNEPIALDQLKERYYEPGLLAKIMGFNKEPLRDVQAFSDPKLYPEVNLTVPTNEDFQLKIDLKRRDGGFGRVVVKINGKELTADVRALAQNANVQPRGDHLVLAVDLADDPRLMPGTENVIEVSAFNEEGYLRSRQVRAIFTPPGERKVTKPDVWAVIIGTSDYRGKAIDLRYAAKDANDFAQALRISATRLFGADKLHLTLLSTAQKDQANWPSKANIIKALNAAKQAKPGDILVIYISGHGVNFGG